MSPDLNWLLGSTSQEEDTSFRTFKVGVPVVAQWLTSPTRNHKDVGLIPGLSQWGKNPALP